MQLVPSSASTYPGRQRRTTHAPDRHETSATPGSAEQSLPMGEYAVRGIKHPPPLAQNKHAATRQFACKDNKQRRGNFLQLSRSRAVCTHSHARRPPPSTPHAAHPGPLSAHKPLPTQLRFLPLGASPPWPEENPWLGHDPASTPHRPLQTTKGASHAQVVGLSGGEGVNPSVHSKAQGFPSMQAGVLWSG